MEKRTVIAIVLSLLILVAWQYLFPPPKPPQVVEPVAEVTEESAQEPVPAQEGGLAPEERPVAPAEAIAAARAEEIPIDNGLFEVVLTNKGGRIASWRLKTGAASEVEVVPEFAVRDDLLPLGLDLDEQELTQEVNAALFQVSREAVPAGPNEQGGDRVAFTWANGRGLKVTKALIFRNGDHLVGLEVEVTDEGRRLPARVTWGPGFEAHDAAGSAQFHYTGQAVWNHGGQVHRRPRTNVEQELKLPSSRALLWAGLEEQYFAALVLPEGPKGELVIRPVEVAPAAPTADPKKAVHQLLVAVSVPPEGARLFVGPKKYTLLRELGHQLEAVVWFSNFALISWLARYLLLSLLWIHDHVVPNYGLAVILLTVALRLLLFPINQHSMVSMKKMQTQMQRIQPKVNAIKAKHRKKKDAETRAKMNQETMALYKKEGVNPMGGMSGCIPMLAQFPILFAFYDMLIAAVELRGAPFFGWIQDLTQKDPWYVTPLLMGATMFLQQKMSITKTQDPQQQQQQRIMLLMPIIFTVMFLNLPSGLVLYWFVNNLLGIGQQWMVNRHIGRLEAAAQKA